MINDTFNFGRFGLLCRQNIHHHYKLIATILLGFCGTLFLLLLFLQLLQDFGPVSSKQAFDIFVPVLMIAGIVYAGTAFPGLRTREKAHQYLMTPASVFEKFLTEVVLRIVLFVLAVPLLYWLVYNLEGKVVQVFYPEFSFGGLFEYSLLPRSAEIKNMESLIYSLFVTGVSVILLTALTGAASFLRLPLLKTLSVVTVIFFFNLFVVYLMLEILEFRKYYSTSGVLAFNQPQLYRFLITVFSVATAWLLVVTYLKIKEKEV